MINGGAMESAQKLKEYQIKTNNNNKFDIDLDFGIHYEKSLAKILSLGKIEVKTERDKWKETRNIAIELSCNSKKKRISCDRSRLVGTHFVLERRRGKCYINASGKNERNSKRKR